MKEEKSQAISLTKPLPPPSLSKQTNKQINKQTDPCGGKNQILDEKEGKSIAKSIRNVQNWLKKSAGS